MPGATPPLPPVLAPPLPPPPPAPGRVPPPARRPASVLRRGLAGLGVSVALAVLGIVPFLGLPGVLPLGIADAVLGGVLKTNPLARLSDSSWAAAIVVTVLAPVPIAPVLALLAWRRPALHAGLAWLVACGAAAFWSLAVAFVVLLAS